MSTSPCISSRSVLSFQISEFLLVFRSGTVHFLRRFRSDRWGCEFSLDTSIRLACYPSLATRTSQSSIPMASTMWLWIFVAATKGLSPTGSSSSAWNGFLRQSINHRRARHFGFWNSSTSSRCQENSPVTNSTGPSSTSPITLSSRFPRWVWYAL